ncbi:Ionotropic receptor 881 [Blattella germanica]|nr:Ionotropic receptor 881 [Blattella germanica]
MKLNYILNSLLCFYVPSVYSKLLEFLEENYIRETTAIANFLESPMFLSVCEDHFNSTRILSILVQDNYTECWKFFINEIIEKMHEHISIPEEVINITIPRAFGGGGSGTGGAGDGHHGQHPPSESGIQPLLPEEIKEYPAESQHSYLLIAHDAMDLKWYLDQLGNEQAKLWNSKDNFTIIIAPMSLEDCSKSSFSSNTLTTLWQRKWVLNAVVILKYLIDCKGKNDTIFTYNPFHRNGNFYGEIITSNAQLDHIPKTYLEHTWNLLGYPLKVSLFDVFPTARHKCSNCEFSCASEYKISFTTTERHMCNQTDSFMDPQTVCCNCSCTFKGRDWEVLKNVATYMNFSIIISNSGIGGDIYEAINSFKNKFSDFAFNERFMKYYKQADIEFTMPAFYTKKIVILVYKAQKFPIWRVIYKYFSGYFWLYFTITFVSSCIFWYYLRRNHENVSQLTNALDMLAVFLTMSVNFVTRIAISSQRILLSCCLIFSMVVMCCFQSSLLDVVANPHYKPDINTMEQLDEAEIPIFTLDSSLLDSFEQSESIHMIHLNERVRYDETLTEDKILKDIIRYKNCSLLTSMTEAHWYLGKYPNSLHIVKEYPREYFVCYIIPRGSPYATRIHNLLGKMSQAGLVWKWDHDSSYELKLEAFRQRKNYKTSDDSSVFILYNLIFSFMVFGAGISAGILVFIVELSSWLDITVRIRNPDDAEIGKAYMVSDF